MSSRVLHSAEDIATFLGDGETRLIAAAYRDPERVGDLFVLADGTARKLRPWAKRELRCMFSDCPAPDLTTVARANRRDGFKHYQGGGGHAPESVNHRQGKAVVAAWLRRLYGQESVAVEEATDTQRSNVADVLLTHQSGRRVAFEVQYSPLSVHAWRERHQSYVAQGIIDIWLWGHTRVHKSRSSYAAGPYRLDDTQDELRQTGMRVTFLNPETEQIGVAAGWWKDDACLATEREFGLSVCSLSEVQMSDEGLTSLLISRLAAASRARDAETKRQEKLRAKEAGEWRDWIARAAEQGARTHQAYLEKKRIEQEEKAARRARIEELRKKRQELLGRDPHRGLAATPLPSSRSDLPVRAGDHKQDVLAPQPSPKLPQLRCSVCGGRLDPLLASSGCHVGPCEWSLS